jgi:hypothetical protein
MKKLIIAALLLLVWVGSAMGYISTVDNGTTIVVTCPDDTITFTIATENAVLKESNSLRAHIQDDNGHWYVYSGMMFNYGTAQTGMSGNDYSRNVITGNWSWYPLNSANNTNASNITTALQDTTIADPTTGSWVDDLVIPANVGVDGFASDGALHAEPASESLSITDANLDSGFPLKSGDTGKKISVCGWFKYDALSNNRAPFTMWDTSNKRSLIPIRYYSGEWQSYLGYNSGASSEQLYSGGTVSTGRWYHFGFTYDDSDRSWKLIVWDDTSGTVVVDTSGTATNNISTEGSGAGIGFGFFDGGPDDHMDGHVDEIVVFKDILTIGEITRIRQGTYGHTGEIKFTNDITRHKQAVAFEDPHIYTGDTVSGATDHLIAFLKCEQLYNTSYLRDEVSGDDSSIF